MEHPYNSRTPRSAALLLTALLALPLALTGCKGNSPPNAKQASAESIPFGSSSSASKGVKPAEAQQAPGSPAAPAAPSAAAPSAAAPATGQAAPAMGVAPSTPPVQAAVTSAKGARKGAKAKAKGPSTGIAIKYNAGEDPDFAMSKGWPVKSPVPLPGSILPQKRIVAYYGNPLSKRMGALGEYPKDEMLQRLKREASRWQAADPAHPVQPALHLIAVVAQGEPGKAGLYRMVMPDEIINRVYGWAKEANAILFIDIQTGHDNIRALLPRFEWILKNPDVHLAIDPEFNLISSKKRPGSKIGTYDASDINYAANYLKGIVKKYNIPPKVFIVHRFTRNMVTNSRKIGPLQPEVQIVMNMDGWGAPWLKRDSYKDYIVSEPVEMTGFKLFYHNDTKKGDPLLTPNEVLKLNPKPVYIQYQ